MQGSPVVVCVALTDTELNSETTRENFCQNALKVTQLEIMNTCYFIMLFQSLEIIKYLQYAAFNLMMSVNLIKISQQFLC